MLDVGTRLWIFLIPLLPFIACTVNWVGFGVFRWTPPHRLLLTISLGAPVVSFLVSFFALVEVAGAPAGGDRLVADGFTWFAAGDFGVEMALMVDPLSAVLACATAAIAALLQLHMAGTLVPYETERDRAEAARMLTLTNLLTGAVLTTILAENALVLFLGWQLTTIAAAVLVGFWFGREDAAATASQAIIVGWVGDAALLFGALGLTAVLAAAGHTSTFFPDVVAGFSTVADRTLGLPNWLGGEWPVPSFVAGFFVLAALSRVAVVPWMGWLRQPDACPDAVLGLLHVLLGLSAAHILARYAFVFSVADGPSTFLAWAGAGIAAISAVRAICAQTTRGVLSYVAVAQTGLMLLGMGVGAPAAGAFVVVTQGFGIAALFALSGAVTLVLRGETRLDAMGGLWGHLHRIKWAFAVALLAVGGAPFLSGFYATDGVLVAVRGAAETAGAGALLFCVLVTVTCTAFALVRLQIGVFHGRGRAALRSPFREPGGLVLFPAAALAFAAAVGGFLGPRAAVNPFPVDAAASNSFANFLAPLFHPEGEVPAVVDGMGWTFLALSLVAGAVGIAVVLLQRAPDAGDRVAAALVDVRRVLEEDSAIDRLAENWVGRPVRSFATRLLVPWVEVRALRSGWDRVMLNRLPRLAGSILAPLTSGRAPAALFWLVLGTAILAGYGVVAA